MLAAFTEDLALLYLMLLCDALRCWRRFLDWLWGDWFWDMGDVSLVSFGTLVRYRRYALVPYRSSGGVDTEGADSGY